MLKGSNEKNRYTLAGITKKLTQGLVNSQVQGMFAKLNLGFE